MDGWVHVFPSEADKLREEWRTITFCTCVILLFLCFRPPVRDLTRFSCSLDLRFILLCPSHYLPTSSQTDEQTAA